MRVAAVEPKPAEASRPEDRLDGCHFATGEVIPGIPGVVVLGVVVGIGSDDVGQSCNGPVEVSHRPVPPSIEDGHGRSRESAGA